MAETVLERDLLKTRIPERGWDVVTSLHIGCRCAQERVACHPWTTVFERERLVWLHFWDGPTTPGGLEEAHPHVVAQVRAGTLPGLDVPEREQVQRG